MQYKLHDLTIYVPTPQNGQTHSAKAGELFVFDHFLRLALKGLKWTRKYRTLDKAKLWGNVYIDSQFSYAPLIWMFCQKTLYLKMQNVHHKTWKVMCKSVPSYDELIKQQRFSFPMTRAVFINRNLYENCFLEVSISVVLRQKQRGSVPLKIRCSTFHSACDVNNWWESFI